MYNNTPDNPRYYAHWYWDYETNKARCSNCCSTYSAIELDEKGNMCTCEPGNYCRFCGAKMDGVDNET